ADGKPVGASAFTMGSRHGVKARTVRQHLWVQRVDLPAGQGKTVAATCILAREFAAPAGVTPIEWRLLTNRAAANLDDAIELIAWYRARWEIV
ncbi:IS4 family transposase, partial [Variovorax sp. 2RAF20]